MSNRSAQHSLPLWRKVGYSAGGLGFDLAFNITSFYLIFYLTSVAALLPVQAGLLAGLPAMILFPLGPLAGVLSDRTQSRVGGRKLFLLVCGPMSGIFLFLKFFAPAGWETTTLAVYWWAVHLASALNGSLLSVSYDALGAELSPSSSERVRLVSMRQSFGTVGALVGSSLPLTVAAALGSGKNGFAAMGAAFGMIVALSFLLVGATASGGFRSTERPLSVWREIGLTLRLRPFWLQLGVAFFVAMAVMVINSMLVFYLTYVHGIAELFPWIMLLATGSALLSLPLWNWLSRRSDSRWSFTIGLLAYAAVLFSLRIVPQGEMRLLWPITALAGMGSGATIIFPKAMITDVAAYDRARRGRSRAGNIMGLWSLGGSGGTAMGSALVGWLLSLVGYRSGVYVTPGLSEGLRSIMGLVPSCLLLATVPLVLCSLSRVEMERTEMTLRKQL